MSVRIRCSAASLRDPNESAQTLIAQEQAIDCDGSQCGFTLVSEDGDWESLPPHWHLIVTGKLPDAGPRHYPIWGR